MADTASLIGKRIGTYSIQSALGRGGMGLVYKAVDLSLGRPAAIKILPHEFVSDEDVVKRFSREARACAQLNHPNIVTVYGVGRMEGNFYIAMEFVEGESLAELMHKRGKFSMREALAIAKQAGEALREAHSRGIVHRDIKPQNIMVDQAGRVKVMDFGLAAVQTEATNLTAAGSTLGTPKYMAPEQWKDSKVDARADMYSLGVTVFEMLAGIPPFTADTPLALMRKIVDEPTPAIRSINAQIPERVAAIVDRMIAKEPADRYTTAEAFLADLTEYMEGRRSSYRTDLAAESSVAEAEPFSSPGLDSQLQAFEAQQRQQAAQPQAQPPTPEPAPAAAPESASKNRGLVLYGAVAAAVVVVVAAGAVALLPGGSGLGLSGPHFVASDFVWIEPGTFRMGSPPNEPGRDPDEQLHEVTLTEGFWMSKYEVTQAQWAAYMESSPAWFQGPELPVENVSWEEVQLFIDRLNREENARFRLPTEAEWEYACRAGSASAYAFGSAPAQLGEYAWFAGNGGGRTHPVGQKRPNAWGLYDMHGNVWEWCQDWAGAYEAGPATDPEGPANGEKRIGRGGSFSAQAVNCRAADRSASPPAERGPDLGFRLVVSP